MEDEKHEDHPAQEQGEQQGETEPPAQQTRPKPPPVRPGVNFRNTEPDADVKLKIDMVDPQANEVTPKDD